MAINEAVNIGINVEGTASVEKAANSYEDLGDAVAKTQLEAERLANTFGINDKRTKEAIKVAGQYKQQMEELDVAIDGARGGVATLTRATQAVVGGFEVAAGAAGLFGTESEELQKALLKVQSAMALSQGISDLKEYGGSIGSLAGMVKGRVVAAFSTLRSAIISTGIGAAVVAVGLLIANWDGLIKKFNVALPTLAEIGSKISNIVQGFTDFLGLTSEAARTNDKINESIAKNISETEKQIAIAKAKGDQDKALALEENQRAAELVLAKRKLREEDSEENRKAVEDARHNLELTRIAQDNYAKDRSKKQKEELKKSQELEAKVKADRDKTTAEMNEFIAKQNEITARGIENVTKTNAISLEQNDIVLKTIEQRQLSALEQAQLFIGAYGAEIKDTFEQSLRAIDALSQAFAGDDEARQKKAFQLSKKLSIVQTTIATIESTVQAFKEAQKNPLNQVTAGAYAISQAAIAAAFGLAQIQQIRNQSFSGGTKPSVPGGGGGQAVPTFNAPSTRLPGGGDEFTQVRRVYVTERDITNVQDKVKVTESLSQF
jgi:hypothetical protein